MTQYCCRAFHDLRHSHAALLIAHREHLKVIQSVSVAPRSRPLWTPMATCSTVAMRPRRTRLDAIWHASRADATLTRRQAGVIELPKL